MKRKKILACILCVALLGTLFPRTVSAEVYAGNNPGTVNYEITEDQTIDVGGKVNRISVAEGKTLTLATVIDANDVTVAGTLYIKGPVEGDPNGLNIEEGGAVRVVSGGAITADAGQILEIRSGATVSGIKLYDADGVTEYTGGFANTEVFAFNSESVRWVRQEPGGGGLQENQYALLFDSNDGAGVIVNDVAKEPWSFNNFVEGETLSFTLKQPGYRQDGVPIVEIRVLNREVPEVFRTDADDTAHKIVLSENTFSFKPSSNAPFEVQIWWSDYDAFEGTKDKPVVVEIDCHGNGSVGIQGVVAEDRFDNRSLTKVRVPVSQTDLVLTWEEGKGPKEIRVDGGDANAEGGWLILKENDFAGSQCSIPLTQTEVSWETGKPVPKTFYHVQVEFDEGDNGGNEKFNFTRLQNELNTTYFAFGDINNSDTADLEDLKYGLMRTLYDGFRVKDGRYQQEGEALGLIEDFNKQDPTNLNRNMEKLMALATISEEPLAGESITATDKTGDAHRFDAYKVTITIDKLYENRQDTTVFPMEEEATVLESPIVLTAKVYLIDMAAGSEQVIIKVKDTYFVRDSYSSADKNADDSEKFEGLNASALVLVAAFDSEEDIVLFGNYAQANEVLSDKSSKRYYAAGFSTGAVRNEYMGGKFVVMTPDFMGVTLNGIGEEKEPAAWSSESSLSIAETGSDEVNHTEKSIYFGFSKIEITPITSGKANGLNVTGIESVELLDGITENAVKIEKQDSDAYIIEFLSDFYDTVRIKVTYSSAGATVSGIVKINRVGILIDGGRTAGDTKTVTIFHGHDRGAELDASVYEAYKAKNSGKVHGNYGFAYYATYYYPTSSDTAVPNVSLFVTYTYADGSVERRLLKSDYFTPAKEGKVAMSDYILYMGDEKNAPVKVEAIAIPDVNEDGTVSGAKFGAGKGVGKEFDFSE